MLLSSTAAPWRKIDKVITILGTIVLCMLYRHNRHTVYGPTLCWERVSDATINNTSNREEYIVPVPVKIRSGTRQRKMFLVRDNR